MDVTTSAKRPIRACSKNQSIRGENLSNKFGWYATGERQYEQWLKDAPNESKWKYSRWKEFPPRSKRGGTSWHVGVLDDLRIDVSS